MRYLVLLFAAMLKACSQPISNAAPQNEAIFVRLDVATEILTIIQNQKEGGVVYSDAFINSQFVVAGKIEYISAPKFGIAISIPKDILRSKDSWKYKNCIFGPSEYTSRRA